MGFGREDAICKYDVVMQILPGSSDDAGAYKRIGEVLQYGTTPLERLWPSRRRFGCGELVFLSSSMTWRLRPK